MWVLELLRYCVASLGIDCRKGLTLTSAIFTLRALLPLVCKRLFVEAGQQSNL